MSEPEWIPDPPSTLPQRSQLYRVQPLGLGTAFVESFSSYVMRLAAAHMVSVSALIRLYIGPFIQDKYPMPKHLSPTSYKSAGYHNGLGIIAEQWVAALSELTMRKDLTYLTLLPFQKIISDKHLLRPTRAWCPQCLNEFREAKHGVYEPLLWRLEAVKICHRHNAFFKTQCPKCMGILDHIAPDSRPGFCSDCGAWLGCTERKEVEEHAIWRALWFATVAGEMLEKASAGKEEPGTEELRQLLRYLIEKRTKGGVRGFAKLARVHPMTVMNWQEGAAVPELSKLLFLSETHKIKLSDWLFQEAHRQ